LPEKPPDVLVHRTQKQEQRELTAHTVLQVLSTPERVAGLRGRIPGSVSLSSSLEDQAIQGCEAHMRSLHWTGPLFIAIYKLALHVYHSAKSYKALHPKSTRDQFDSLFIDMNAACLLSTLRPLRVQKFDKRDASTMGSELASGNQRKKPKCYNLRA